MKTIAQQIKWDFETNGGLEILNKNGKRIYLELSDGYWSKREYDSKGKEIYCEDSDGVIIDYLPKPCENKEIVIDGVKYKLTKV